MVASQWRERDISPNLVSLTEKDENAYTAHIVFVKLRDHDYDPRADSSNQRQFPSLLISLEHLINYIIILV
jgi:hypothetical protein